MESLSRVLGTSLCLMAGSAVSGQVDGVVQEEALRTLSHVAPGDVGPIDMGSGARHVRSGLVVLDEEVVRGMRNAGGHLLEITLFEDVRFHATFDRREDFGEGRYSWVGRHGAESGDWFVLSVVNGSVAATFWTSAGEIYEILPTGHGDVYLSRELEGVGFEECATCAGALHQHAHDHAVDWTVPEPALVGRNTEDDGSEIQVMVAYTPAARNALGGTNGIEAHAQNAIASTNTAYANSQINTRVELVWVGLVNYTESSSANTDLSRLRGTSDGNMDELHTIREDVKADMVALLSDVSGFCGIAYLMDELSPSFATSAFSVTDWSCAVGNLTFAHELGHNQGSAHDRSNAGAALFNYSYGHRWSTTSGSLRRSVMAYAPGTRRPYFSNPNVTDGGGVTGVANSEDNARSINEAAFTVANFRVSTPPPPPPEAPGAFALLTPADGATDVDPNSFFIMTWESAERADSYTIGIARDAGMTDYVVGPVSRSSPNLTLFPGIFDEATVYYWSVVAANENPDTTTSTPVVASFSTLGFETECAGDITGDNVVDLGDFNVLGLNFGAGPGATREQGDLSGDGFVDLADFNVVGLKFGTVCE